MRIVDAHMHLGEDLMFNTDDSEEVLLDAMGKNGVDAQLLMPGIVSRDQAKAHVRIRDFAEKHPGRAYGIACFNPLMGDDEYSALVRWAVRDLGFKGIKLHPFAFCMAPSHPAADKVFRLGSELGVPVMIHTGNGVPPALPALCIPVARKYPDLTFVLAHAGGGMYAGEAAIVAELCPNVYLETSWVPVYELAAMVARLGPERLMFGADLVSNIPVELAKYRALGLGESQLERCLGGTAEKVFGVGP